MTTAVYDGIVCDGCYYCLVGRYASLCSAVSSQPV